MIGFPKQNYLMTAAVMADDLGTGLADGAPIGCYSTDQTKLIPVTGSEVTCTLRRSGYGLFTVIELTNFQNIPVGTFAELIIQGVKNPATAADNIYIDVFLTSYSPASVMLNHHVFFDVAAPIVQAIAANVGIAVLLAP